MKMSKTLCAAVALVVAGMPAFAADVMVNDAYFRTSGPAAKSGGAFMQIMNHSAVDDRLISVTSDVAKRVELHEHIDAGNGVMQMREVEAGFPVPAGGMHVLDRGGDHLMFMGLTRHIHDGDMIEVILTFEKAGEIAITVPVDLRRMPKEGGGSMNHDHSTHDHNG